jgi:class 3 adenylate cyclase/tetratricopeptide (TPR) repeat protein
VPTCASCAQENPAGSRFCNSCGAPLQRASAELREERKVVSVLFVDLVGFTGRFDRADPEDVRALLRPYHARLKREIERYEGTVEKFVGDAVMAVFGAPVAHEDDAERAVRAGLRILTAIDELNDHEGLGLTVRGAVNTGEAVVALDARPEVGEGIVAGDIVNTASRLQAAAPVGGLLVGENTYQATRHVIDYKELEPVVVKGKADPLPAWRARAPLGGVGADLDRPALTPFVGREHELVLLKETYARMLRERSPQLVTVVGEPGVGKTRFVSEFRAFIDTRSELAWWRQGRCLPYGEGISFWALGEVVKTHAGILESDGSARAMAKLQRALEPIVSEPSELDWLKARLAPLVGAESTDAPSVERAELFTAWRRFLEALATSRPVVLVVEDLHWADAALPDFLEHLLDWSTVPILVVCTARPELYDQRAAWGGGMHNSTTIALSPLTDQETSRLLGALLSAVLPTGTQAALLKRAGGNPLYAEEFVRMLADRGILARRGRVLELDQEADIPVPATVQALVAARLDTLAAEQKVLLQDAAVLGEVFWTSALASMQGTDEEIVTMGLHDLARKDFVRLLRTSTVQGETEYSFWHLLIRDVAYGQIPRAARVRKHTAAAGWIEGMAGDRVADHAEMLVHHYGQALELARAAGADTHKIEEETKRTLVLAGERALRLDVGKAESYYRRALELLPPDAPERAKVVAQLAEAIALAGRYPEAEAAYAEAITGLKANSENLAAGEALVKLSIIVRDRGEAVRARALLGEAVELLEQAPPGPELVLAYTHLARYYHFTWPPEECFEWAEKAIAMAAELGIEDEAMRARVFRGFTRFEIGDPRGLHDLKTALRTGLELGVGEDTAGAYIGLGDIVWWTEGPTAGLDVYRAGMEFTERRGMTYYTMYLKGESVWPLFDLGEWDSLLEAAGEIFEWDRASYQALLALPYVAHVYLFRGQVAEAASLREEFLHRARQSADPQVLMPALAISALIDAARGNFPAAISFIEQIEQVTGDRPVRRAQHLADALRVCAAAGATRLGETLLEGIEVSAARQLHAVHSARAVLAEAHGKLEQALHLHREAADRWASYGFVLEEGQALLSAGRCLLGLERRDEAASRLETARTVFSSLRADPLLAETNTALAQLASARAER